MGNKVNIYCLPSTLQRLVISNLQAHMWKSLANNHKYIALSDNGELHIILRAVGVVGYIHLATSRWSTLLISDLFLWPSATILRSLDQCSDEFISWCVKATLVSIVLVRFLSHILIKVSPVCVAGPYTHHTMDHSEGHEHPVMDETSIVNDAMDVVMKWKPMSDVYVYNN